MIEKLECYGIGWNGLDWFESYLEHRVQRVHLNGVMSSWEELKLDVPDGSIRGPLFFTIYLVSEKVDVIVCMR